MLMPLALPGERIEPLEARPGKENATANYNVLPGGGTYLHGPVITSSVLGTRKSDLASESAGYNDHKGKDGGPAKATAKGDNKAASPIISVQPANSRAPRLPRVNDIVLARVTRINPRQATVLILAVGVPGDPSLDPKTSRSDATSEQVLPPYHPQTPAQAYQALIRAQDVRATEKDKVRIPDSFRPGDVVRAIVISLGDQANYYCTTARNDLGVVFATSESGNAMIPRSWCEFWDPVTNRAEQRKSARPF